MFVRANGVNSCEDAKDDFALIINVGGKITKSKKKKVRKTCRERDNRKLVKKRKRREKC